MRALSHRSSQCRPRLELALKQAALLFTHLALLDTNARAELPERKWSNRSV